jgi:hypothetical protein
VIAGGEVGCGQLVGLGGIVPGFTTMFFPSFVGGEFIGALLVCFIFIHLPVTDA